MIMLNNLYELFIPWISNYFSPVIVTGMELDSRHITKGDLFVAVVGHNTDGRLYIDHAIEKGAAAVLSEFCSDGKTVFKKYICHNNYVPIIYINYLDRYLSHIAGFFYNHPSRLLNVIGVTGTNGKTSVTVILANWTQLLKEKSVVMGTLGYGKLGSILNFDGTTYSAVDNQRLLAQFIQDKIKLVAMEVSSHGLEQHRVDALYFKVAVFTNLSHDHLDYHNSIVEYVMAKQRLFEELYVEQCVINADDAVGKNWLCHFPESIAVTVANNLPKNWKGRWISAVNINCHFYGTDIYFNSSWGKGVIYSQLIGMFNVSNLLLALAALLALGYSLSLLLQVSAFLRPVCGRMEVFRSYHQSIATVVVDYAHTPDALKQVLILIKQYCRGKLWCIFGCGGDRDQDKRAVMGSIAATYSDVIIVTNDNPRTENPKEIIDDIICGMVNCTKVVKIIQDRSQAILTAISQALSEDLILIAGKGHEQYQIVGNNRVNYSDIEVVKNILRKN